MKKSIHWAFRKLGYRVVPYSNAFAPIQRLPEVDFVFDVGVGEGTSFLYERYPDAEYLLVEPNRNFFPEIERNVLPRLNARLQRCALGSVRGQASLKSLGERSTFFDPTEIEAIGTGSGESLELQVEIRTLDELVGDLGLDLLDRTTLLKIDTEGSELEVLKGASATLPKIDFVIAEVSTAPRYVTSYSFDELLLFMSESGFVFKEVLNACFDHTFEVYSSIDMIWVNRSRLDRS